MGDEIVEREYMGKGRAKVWTYLILMVFLIIVAVVINLVWNNPQSAREGITHFLGLPSYLLALVLFLGGALIFWMGLKMETDWPEAFGAFLITAAITWGEFIIGWQRFDIGGLVVLPYVIPVCVFALLLIYGMKKSV
jgi:hypothetical protein